MLTASDCIKTGKSSSWPIPKAKVRTTRAEIRVYYLPLPMLALATSVARPNLVSLGTCFGKFSKSGKFKLGVTAVDWLATYAKYKVSIGGAVQVGSKLRGAEKRTKRRRDRR